MTAERFAALAAAYGAEIGRWPMAEQAAAQAYLAQDAEAGTVLAAEARLDAALATWVVPGPGAVLAGRIAAEAAARKPRLRWLWRWAAGAGAAATLGGGVLAGMALVTWIAPPPEAGFQGLYGVRVLGAPLDVDGSPAGGER